MDDDEFRSHRRLIVLDSIHLLTEVVQLKERLDEAAADEAERFADGSMLVDAIDDAVDAGRDVPTGAVLMAVAICLHNWSGSGPDLAQLLPEDDSLERAGVTPLDAAVVRCLSSLGPVERLDDEDDPLPARSAATLSFLALQAELARADRASEAERVASAAANYAPTPDVLRESHERALESAIAADDRSAVALHLAGRAEAMAARAAADGPTGPQARASMDAYEAAVRALASADPVPDTAIRLLLRAETHIPAIAEQRFLLRFALGDLGSLGELDQEGKELLERVRLLPRPVWDLSLEDLWATASTGLPMLTSVENRRLELSARDPIVQLETSWTTMMFEHPRYREAVPHGRTLFREGRIDSILGELTHEATHVASLLGGLGGVFIALRAVATEFEVTLWAHVEEERREDSQRSLVAPLTEASVLALAQAEQAVDTIYKLRILQRIWNPWLEGVAVFVELGADPTEGDLATLVGDLMVNLVDVGIPPGMVAAEGLAEYLLQRRIETENLYASVLRRAGRRRLRAYLDGGWRKYGAGYLAVRAIVSGWRGEVDRPVSGTDAARVLLHLTRQGTHDAVPDLSLPAYEFAQAAEQSMLDWVCWLRALPGPQLEPLFANSSSLDWVTGPISEALASGRADSNAVYRQRVSQAWSCGRGSSAAPARVAAASAECGQVMEVAAEALTAARQRSDLTDSIGLRLDAQSHVLPIGRTDVPVWLNERTGSLICYLRTTEQDKDHGRPGYDGLALPLDEAQFTALRAQLRHHPERRMTVTRLVDLVNGQDSSRRAGTNVLVFELGDWMHVQNRGLSFGRGEVDADLVDDIKRRLHPDAADRNEAEICDGEAAARRTVDWVESVETPWGIDGVAFDVEDWVRYVHDLATAVRDRTDELPTEARAGIGLLDQMFPTVELGQRGVRGLVDGQADRLAELIEFLSASARAPVPSDWLDGLAADDPVFGLIERTPHGWDVRRR